MQIDAVSQAEWTNVPLIRLNSVAAASLPAQISPTSGLVPVELMGGDSASAIFGLQSGSVFTRDVLGLVLSSPPGMLFLQSRGSFYQLSCLRLALLGQLTFLAFAALQGRVRLLSAVSPVSRIWTRSLAGLCCPAAFSS